MRTKPTFLAGHSASLRVRSPVQAPAATWVKVTPSVLAKMVYEVMSPSVDSVRFHCLGRYSRVETLLHTPPRSMVTDCGSGRLQVDQQVS